MENLVEFPLSRKERIALIQPGSGFIIEDSEKKAFQQAASEYNKENKPDPKVGVRKGKDGRYVVGRKGVK